MSSQKTSKQPVSVTAKAKDFVLDLTEWSGQNQQTVVERFFEWGADMLATDEGKDVIGAIIGALPKSRRPDFARLILEQLAESTPKPEKPGITLRGKDKT